MESTTMEQSNHSTMREGLLERLIRMWKRHQATKAGRALELVETLPVGARRQLMLVRCGREHFLVGGGVESIQTIVRLDGAPSFEELAQ